MRIYQINLLYKLYNLEIVETIIYWQTGIGRQAVLFTER